MKLHSQTSDDYSRPAPPPFPKELALKIARKVATLAQTFEDRALDQMIRDAQRALQIGMKSEEIARQMGL
jgi:hypothetical protein